MDIGGNTPLHLATERDMKDVVSKFLQCGGDPEIPNQQGFSCLHIAAREGHTDLVKMFIAKDINLDQRDTYGYNAAYWAHQMKHQKISELLPPPLKVTKEEYYEHIQQVWKVHDFKKGGKKGKKGKGKKKKK